MPIKWCLACCLLKLMECWSAWRTYLSTSYRTDDLRDFLFQDGWEEISGDTSIRRVSGNDFFPRSSGIDFFRQSFDSDNKFTATFTVTINGLEYTTLIHSISSISFVTDCASAMGQRPLSWLVSKFHGKSLKWLGKLLHSPDECVSSWWKFW